jgi:hypothetical protein
MVKFVDVTTLLMQMTRKNCCSSFKLHFSCAFLMFIFVVIKKIKDILIYAGLSLDVTGE